MGNQPSHNQIDKRVIEHLGSEITLDKSRSDIKESSISMSSISSPEQSPTIRGRSMSMNRRKKPVLKSPVKGIEEEIPRPGEEEIDKQLELAMDDLNLPADKKDEFRAFDLDRKWELIKRNKQDSDESSRDEILRKLRNLNPDFPVIEAKDVLVTLRSKPVRWIQLFIELEGLSVIMESLKRFQDIGESQREEICIRCVRALMNTNQGFIAILDYHNSLSTFCLSISSKSLKAKIQALDILAAVCMVPGQHKIVVEALSSTKSDFESRLQRILPCFIDINSKNNGNVTTAEIDLMVSAFAFINSVLHSENTASLEYRLHLRKELFDIGFAQVIEKLTGFEHPDIQAQIEIFNDATEEDEKEIAEKANIDQKKFQLAHPESLYQMIFESFRGTRLWKPLINILFSLLLAPENGYQKGRIMFAIDAILRQVVLQKEGEDPDPLVRIIKFDVRTLYDSIKIMEAKLEGSNSKNGALIDSAKMKDTIRLLIKDADLYNQLINSLEKEGYIDSEDSETSRSNLSLNDETLKVDTKLSALDKITEHSDEVIATPLSSQVQEKASSEPLKTETLINPPSTDAHGPPPPPPMEGQSNIPPPPPGAGGPPPPPGSMFGAMFGGLPQKKTNLSSRPMKPLQWTKLPNPRIKSTIWKDIDDEKVRPMLNWVDFEDLFENLQKDKKQKEDKDDKPKELKLIEGKKSQNLSILLKNVKLPIQDIRKALFTVNTAVLSVEVIGQLLKFVPTKEEIELIRKNLDKKDLFGEAERYFMEIMDINMYEDRLKSIAFRENFEEHMKEAENLIRKLRLACTELRTSEKFKKILQVTLALGNHMNTGQKAGAYGFAISSLLKLSDTKSKLPSRRYTLLHFLDDIIETKFPECADFVMDLSSVDGAVKVRFNDIKSQLSGIKNNVDELRKTIQELTKAASTDKSDKFNMIFEAFLKRADARVHSSEQELAEAETSFESTAEFFAEDPKNTSPEDFFAIFQTFITLYQQAHRENQEYIARIKELEKREVRKRVIWLLI
eukprot:NODE_222_length_13951_cov_0.396982.p1 type:complete len:1016 gc:universal NODE_222_length_13951_cov_0.396982:1079-4126(+)